MISQLGVKVAPHWQWRRQVRYTTQLPTPFRRIADTVCRRLSELLCSQVAVIDESGVIRACSRAALIDRPIGAEGTGEPDDVWIPLRIAGQQGTVIITPPENGEVLSPRLVQELVELIVHEVSTVERLPSRHELKDIFIHDLLSGAIEDEEAIQRHARILSLDFTTPRAVILIDAATFILPEPDAEHDALDDTYARWQARLVIERVIDFFQFPNDTVCSYMGASEVVVLKAGNTKNLAMWVDKHDAPECSSASWANLRALVRAGEGLLANLESTLDTSITIGIGRYYPGVAGLARSYQDARTALLLGKHFNSRSGVHCLSNLGVVAFVGLQDEQTKVDLADYLLSPLDYEPDLLKTIETFFSNNCSPSATATQLAIHRNTLSYRLDKITALIGLDPRSFDDAVQIRLALILRCLQMRAD